MKSSVQLRQSFLNLLDSHLHQHAKSLGLRLLKFLRLHKETRELAKLLKHFLSAKEDHDSTKLLSEIYFFCLNHQETAGTNTLVLKILNKIADELGIEKSGLYNKGLGSIAYVHAGPYVRQECIYQKIEKKLVSRFRDTCLAS